MEIETIAAALLLAAALATDLKHQRIPNGLTALFWAGGMGFHAIGGGGGGLAAACAGSAAGLVPLLLLYWAKGIGAGDVKLFGAVGAWIGIWEVLQLMLYSFLYAGGIAAVLLLARRAVSAVRFRAADGQASGEAPEGGRSVWPDWMRQGSVFPFMLAVAPAALTVWLLLN